MSDKPKVYQGVRVKTTVKELLQQRRALQAERIKTVKTKSQNLANHSQDVCISTLPAHYFDAFTGEANPDISFQQRSYPEHSCNMQMESAFAYQHPVSSMMILNEGYNSILPPPPSASAQPWSHGHHSPKVDYHNHSMTPTSPSDSLNLASPLDYSNFSPQESYSSSSSCYNSPTRMDSRYGLGLGHYHYQHCNLQHCYCLSHWSGLQESITPDYALYGPTDCAYASPVESSYFRRDLSSDMCYL